MISKSFYQLIHLFYLQSNEFAMQTYARQFAYASHHLNETELKYLHNSLRSKSARQPCIYLFARQNTVVNRTDDRHGELPHLCSNFINNLWSCLRAIHTTGH